MSHVFLKYIVHIQMVGTYLKKRKEKKNTAYCFVVADYPVYCFYFQKL